MRFGGEKKDTVAGGYYESGYSVSEKLDSEGVTATVKENLNPGAVRHIADAADDIGKWRGYIREQAEREAEHVIFHEGEEVLLRRDACRGLPEVCKKEILSLFLEQGISGVKMSRAHYEALYERIAHKGNGTFLCPAAILLSVIMSISGLRKISPKSRKTFVWNATWHPGI